MSNESNDWPANAVPRFWVEELFKKLSAYFGARLADAWRGSDIEAVKREWGIALAKLSPAELRAGVGALLMCKYPPTLPEFFMLCKQSRSHDANNGPRLTDQTRASEATVTSNSKRMRDLLRSLNATRTPGTEWAHRLLERGTSASGRALTPEVIRCAMDAIKARSVKREPGEDDEGECNVA